MCKSMRGISRNVNQLEPLQALPSGEELVALGGRWFVRPSDGRRLEYFVRGDRDQPNVLTVVHIVCTTATGLLYHEWDAAEMDKVLAARNAKLVNVSAAGVGPSEPYGETSMRDPRVTTGEYLQRTSRDVIALLDHLGAERVCFVGVSGGWEPAAHAASTLAKRTPSRVMGVCSISGIPWMDVSRPRTFWEKSMGQDGWQMRLAVRFNRWSLSPYLVQSMFPMDPKRTAKATKKETLAALAQHGRDANWLETLIVGINRSAAYWAFVAGFLGAIAANPEADAEASADLAALGTFPVHVHYSVADNMVPMDKVVAWLTEPGRVPNAVLFENTHDHMDPPFVQAVDQLLASASAAGR